MTEKAGEEAAEPSGAPLLNSLSLSLALSLFLSLSLSLVQPSGAPLLRDVGRLASMTSSSDEASSSRLSSRSFSSSCRPRPAAANEGIVVFQSESECRDVSSTDTEESRCL